MKHLPWILLAIVLAVPLFAQGRGPFRLIHASLVESVPIDVRVPGQPRAKDIVRIVEGLPYVVPSGRMLVITAIGTRHNVVESVILSIDGVEEVSRKYWLWSGGAGVDASLLDLPAPGLVAGPGQTVVVTGGIVAQGDDARAWGYLEDAG